MKIQCKSVPGGWQTVLPETDETFGPVFNKVTDLWKWQGETFGKGAADAAPTTKPGHASIAHLSISSQIFLREFDMDTTTAIGYAERIAQRAQTTNPRMAEDYTSCANELKRYASAARTRGLQSSLN